MSPTSPWPGRCPAPSAPQKRLLADKAYDARHFRCYLAGRKIQSVIPSTASRTVPYPIDRNAYTRRNGVERLFGRLKNWRRTATRYDRLARNVLAAIALIAAISEWAA